MEVSPFQTYYVDHREEDRAELLEVFPQTCCGNKRRIRIVWQVQAYPCSSLPSDTVQWRRLTNKPTPTFGTLTAMLLLVEFKVRHVVVSNYAEEN